MNLMLILIACFSGENKQENVVPEKEDLAVLTTTKQQSAKIMPAAECSSEKLSQQSKEEKSITRNRVYANQGRKFKTPKAPSTIKPILDLET